MVVGRYLDLLAFGKSNYTALQTNCIFRGMLLKTMFSLRNFFFFC